MTTYQLTNDDYDYLGESLFLQLLSENEYIKAPKEDLKSFLTKTLAHFKKIQEGPRRKYPHYLCIDGQFEGYQRKPFKRAIDRFVNPTWNVPDSHDFDSVNEINTIENYLSRWYFELAPDSQEEKEFLKDWKELGVPRRVRILESALKAYNKHFPDPPKVVDLYSKFSRYLKEIIKGYSFKEYFYKYFNKKN
jgi:hypothetical protein